MFSYTASNYCHRVLKSHIVGKFAKIVNGVHTKHRQREERRCETRADECKKKKEEKMEYRIQGQDFL